MGLPETPRGTAHHTPNFSLSKHYNSVMITSFNNLKTKYGVFED